MLRFPFMADISESIISMSSHIKVAIADPEMRSKDQSDQLTGQTSAANQFQRDHAYSKRSKKCVKKHSHPQIRINYWHPKIIKLLPNLI
jgi:hypothetical protein